MSKSLRRSENLYRAGLWFVAFLFANALTGLGSLVIGDLPKVEQSLAIEQFMDNQQRLNIQADIEKAQTDMNQAREAEERARLDWQEAQSNTQLALEQYNTWLTTRGGPQSGSSDEEALKRTRQLDNLRAIERLKLAKVQEAERASVEARQSHSSAREQLSDLRIGAQSAYDDALRAQELRVFLFRLALTMPLLLAAGWLFKKHRKGTWWPFVWGFIGFALIAFFVELVPYLPSYGGYVRSITAILIIVIGGRQAVISLNRYLERQRALEARPEQERRKTLDHEQALLKLSKSLCPGCERPVDLKSGDTSFCPQCGLGLFKPCGSCQTKVSTFSRYCRACGTESAEFGLQKT